MNHSTTATVNRVWSLLCGEQCRAQQGRSGGRVAALNDRRYFFTAYLPDQAVQDALSRLPAGVS